MRAAGPGKREAGRQDRAQKGKGPNLLCRCLAGLAGFLFLVLCAHQILGENGYFMLRARRQEARQLEVEIRRLSEENKHLEQQIKKLRSDPGAIERIAREEMKLARPREFIYLLPAPPSPSQPSEAQARSK